MAFTAASYKPPVPIGVDILAIRAAVGLEILKSLIFRFEKVIF